MRRHVVLLIAASLILPGIALADTVSEVEQAIKDSFANTRETLESKPDEIAAGGSAEFWSSAGLMRWTDSGAEPSKWESFTLRPKHIVVVPLVEGKAAVAMYYSEGSMQPKGYPLVPNYLSRVTEVLVKEDGKWKRRAGHWSALRGGAGTSQPAE